LSQRGNRELARKSFCGKEIVEYDYRRMKVVNDSAPEYFRKPYKQGLAQ
jgi:hypothetical protein